MRHAILSAMFFFIATRFVSAEVNITYMPTDGRDPNYGNVLAGTLVVESTERTITTFELISAGSLFRPDDAADVFSPPFDVITEDKLFKLAAGDAAFSQLNFGPVLIGGLSEDALLADLTINGSLTPDGSGNNRLDANGLSVILGVPEPSSAALAGIGLLTVLSLRRPGRAKNQ